MSLMETFSIVFNVMVCLGGPGLCDPCEKDAINACAEITAQEAEDLTAAAQVQNYINVHFHYMQVKYYCFLQHALRLQAFRQLHKVLGIDAPPPAPRYRGRYPRGGRFKRRREDSGQGDEGAKKEKKEGEGEASTTEVMETTTTTTDNKDKQQVEAQSQSNAVISQQVFIVNQYQNILLCFY